MLGDQIIEAGKDKYPLRLSFEAVKRIETTLNKSLIHLDALSFYEMSIALSATADVDEEKAFEIISEAGLERIAIAVKSLVVETFNPAKKSQAAAKKPKS